METLSQIAQILSAAGTLVAAVAAWRAANAARDAAVASRKAAIAPVVEVVRSRTNAVSKANRALADFVRTHGENFVEVFSRDTTQLAEHRQAVKEVFVILAVYVDLGIITVDEIKKTTILSDSTADIFLGVVERMEKVINKQYTQRHFELAKQIFNKERFPNPVSLLSGKVPVRDL